MALAYVATPFSSNNFPISPEDTVHPFAVSLIALGNRNRNEKEGMGQVLKWHSLPERY
jgi:hypothetical protein